MTLIILLKTKTLGLFLTLSDATVFEFGNQRRFWTQILANDIRLKRQIATNKISLKGFKWTLKNKVSVFLLVSTYSV